MTKQQKISSLYKTTFQSISVANGYLTNFNTNKIYVWNTKILPKDETFYVNIKDGKDYYEGQYGKLDLTIEIGCSVSNNYTTITNMIQDIKKAVQDSLSSFLGVFSYYEAIFVESDFEIMQEDRELAEGYILFEIIHEVNEYWTLDETVYT